MLKSYVKMSAKITKTHRVNKFKQHYICRDFIQINADKKSNS